MRFIVFKNLDYIELILKLKEISLTRLKHLRIIQIAISIASLFLSLTSTLFQF